MYPIKISTSQNILIFVHDTNGVGVTGKVDGDFSKFISKNGGTFSSMTVTITERQAGWYALTLSTAHTDTLGVLSMYFTCSGAMQTNLQYRVETTTLSDLFDAEDGIDNNLTLREAFRLITAATAGDAVVSGNQVSFTNPIDKDKTRIVATTDRYGNRTVTTVDKT